MLCHYTEFHYPDCRVLFIIMLNVIMLNVIGLSIIMLIVVMLNVTILIVVVPINCVAKLIGEKLKVARAEFSTLS
jgi:ABC-type transport system involved in cytochrome bd biosynthesis fused ATPase/permease subunit